MPIYLLICDLRRERSWTSYQLLWTELRRLDAHKVFPTAWLVNAEAAPQSLLDRLRPFLSHDDGLLLTRLREGEFTGLNAEIGTDDWISRNHPS